MNRDDKNRVTKTAKSVIFTTDEVRAILREQNLKTQFRRPIKPQPKMYYEYKYYIRDVRKGLFQDDFYECYIPIPYFPGDILYIRETWGEATIFDITDFEYKADCEKKPPYVDKWKSPATMPKETARIFLRVTGFRVERLQDISGRDILAEGVDNGASNPKMGMRWENQQRMAFCGV